MPRGRGTRGTPETGPAERDAGAGARRDFPAKSGGAGYGTRKKFQAMQEAAPQRGRQSGQPNAPQMDPVDIFGPSMRPNEPATAGIGPGDDERKFVPKDPDLMLKVAYAKHPHPDILRLLNRRVR